SFFYLALGYFAPPFFLDSDTSGQPFSNLFAAAPPESSFPLIQPGSSVAATVIDRNARTPYTQQFNTSVQYELSRNTTLQVSYAISNSTDNASNRGGGANANCALDRRGGLDTANVWGNQLNPRANRGVSDFDRTHYFVFSFAWNLPEPAFARGSTARRFLFS